MTITAGTEAHPSCRPTAAAASTWAWGELVATIPVGVITGGTCASCGGPITALDKTVSAGMDGLAAARKHTTCAAREHSSGATTTAQGEL